MRQISLKQKESAAEDAIFRKRILRMRISRIPLPDMSPQGRLGDVRLELFYLKVGLLGR